MGQFSDVSITDDQIREHFQEYGNVVELQRPVNSRARPVCKVPFCFITFEKEEPAARLIEKGGVSVAGQVVQIKRAFRMDTHLEPKVMENGEGKTIAYKSYKP